jgi:hypothetical protein
MSTFSSSWFVWLSTLLLFAIHHHGWVLPDAACLVSGSWSTIDHNTFDLNPLLRADEVSGRLNIWSFPCNLPMMCTNHSWADEVSGMFGAGQYKKLLNCTNHLWANEVSGMFCSWTLPYKFPYKLLLQIISATVSLVQTALLFSFSSRIWFTIFKSNISITLHYWVNLSILFKLVEIISIENFSLLMKICCYQIQCTM